MKKLTKAQLESLLAEATVDAYEESEALSGLFTMIEDHLALPFDTRILGVDVTVVDVDINDREDIVVICKRGRARQAMSIFDLPLPSPPPVGWEWIEVYREWARRR